LIESSARNHGPEEGKNLEKKIYAWRNLVERTLANTSTVLARRKLWLEIGVVKKSQNEV